MLKQRVLTAVVGLPIIILAIWLGNLWFTILIAAVALGGTLEFYRLVNNAGKGHPLSYFGLLWAVALIFNPLVLHWESFDTLPITMTLGIVISLVLILFHSKRNEAFNNWAWTIAGVLYVAFMLSYWLNLRYLDYGRYWVYLAMLTTFANDTGAFFIGRAKGKHKLAITISPSKTWEGVIGGLFSAILGIIIMTTIFNLISPLSLEYWQVIPLGFSVSFFAQFGDLVESLLKRNMGTKESGKLLPGHGGILDRFDSLLFVGPVVYYYVVWIV